MDTDDLSIPTYKGIISEAEKFNHELTLPFGVLAASCKDDDDYLNQAEALIKDWLQVNDFEDIIDGIFFGQKVNENAFCPQSIFIRISACRRPKLFCCYGNLRHRRGNLHLACS